jgi:hypothetical protein
MAANKGLIGQLRHLYESDEACKDILDDFAEREKNSWRSSVDRVCQRTQLSRGDVIRVLKTLGEIGDGALGRFVVGRRRQPSRFEWTKSSLSVGRAAAGEATELEERPTDEDEIEDDQGAMATYRFPLRKDCEIQFVLPSDLTEKEADRIANYVRTLPI